MVPLPAGLLKGLDTSSLNQLRLLVKNSLKEERLATPLSHFP
jgi:hypothetical protein